MSTPATITKEEVIKKLEAIVEIEREDGDTENEHVNADQILLDYLAQLKETEIVEAYLKARANCGFWYS